MGKQEYGTLSDVSEKASLIRTGLDLPAQNEMQSLYDEYHAPLVSFFGRKLPRDEDPEDMAQQVFIKLVEAIKHTEAVFSRNFIFVVARNALIDRLRWRKSHRIDEHDAVEDSVISSDAPLPDRILQGKQELDRFFGHLDNLPLRCRQVFLLHRVYNMPQKDIAKHLGISLSTVQKHMMNAMGKLQDSLRNGRSL